MTPEQNTEKEMKMNHADILRESESKDNELDNSFGPREFVFDRAARIATILLNIEFTAYDVSIIVTSLNLAQMQANRSNPENYVSTIVNVALAGQFAAPEDKIDDELMKGIEEIAKKYSPTKMPNVEASPTV
jgi:hypothetical protein